MRTPGEYYSDLIKMRKNVYIGGKKVGRDDARLIPGINVMKSTFSLAQKPDWQDVMTAKCLLHTM